jgi:ATP-dependent Clp protease ATP-binding subunit ClpA
VTEAQIRAHLLADVGEQLMGHFVNAAKEAGASRSAIGEALGVSKQAAQQRGRQFFAGFTKRAAHAVVLAQDAARIRRSTDIGTEHLLLGLLGEQEGLAARIVVRHAGSPERAEQAVAGVLRPDGEDSSAPSTCCWGCSTWGTVPARR